MSNDPKKDRPEDVPLSFLGVVGLCLTLFSSTVLLSASAWALVEAVVWILTGKRP